MGQGRRFWIDQYHEHITVNRQAYVVLKTVAVVVTVELGYGTGEPEALQEDDDEPRASSENILPRLREQL